MTTYYTRRVTPDQVRPGMFINTTNERTGEVIRQRVKKVTPRACSKRGMHVEFEGSKLVACYSPYLRIQVTVTRKDEEIARTEGNAKASGRKNQGGSGRTAKGKAAAKGRRGNSERRQGGSGSPRNGRKGAPRG